MHQDRVGLRAIRRDGPVAEHRRRRDGTRHGALPIGEYGHRHRGVLDEGLGQCGAACLLEHEHEVELRATQSAIGIGREHPEHSHVGELRPHRVGTARGVAPRRADDRGRALFFEQVAHSVAERELVVGECEPHGAQALGSPSTRSAITLRWISFVPA